MIWTLRRILVLIVLISTLAVVAYEVNLAMGDQAYRMIPAGELWFSLDVASLNLVQAVVERYIHPVLWQHVLFPVLLWPADLVLGVPGLVLLAFLMFRRRRRLL